jgi:hypothetical protein
VSASPGHRIFTTSVASVYPLYLAKLERKGRSRSELDEVIGWLTGFDAAALAQHLAAGTTFGAEGVKRLDAVACAFALGAHAAADPLLLLSEFFIGGGTLALLGFEAIGATLEKHIVGAGPVSERAAVEFNDTRGEFL